MCLHIQLAVPQHSQVACDRSDRDVGSRNAESSSKDVVLTRELDDDVFFLIYHDFVCSHSGSDLLDTVLYIANSPSGVKDLEGQIELGVIHIQLHTQVVLACYVSDWGGIKCKQLRSQDTDPCGMPQSSFVCERRSHLCVQPGN